MNPTHAAILSVIGHGGAKDLLSNSFDIRWIEEGDERVVIQRALSLCQQGQPVNIASVMQGITVRDWQPIFQAWTDGYGSSASVITEKAKSEYVRKQIGDWLKTTNELYSKSPQETLKWWPKQVMLARDLGKAATLYNPSPVELAKKPIPQLWKPFTSPTLSKLFSGGVWKPGVVGISGPTGQGKTTMTVTVAGDCATIGAKCVIFSADWEPQYYVLRVMMYFGFSEAEYVKFTQEPDDSERCKEFYECLTTVSSWLSVYGTEYMDTKAMDFALSVEQPDVFVVDHVLALRLEKSAGNESYAIGQAMYSIRDMALKYRCMSVAFGQLNDKDSQEFIAKHTLPMAKFFGSSIAPQSINLGILLQRYWEESAPSKEYFLIKKNSIVIGGNIDQVYYMAYDKSRASYVEAQEQERTIQL